MMAAPSLDWSAALSEAAALRPFQEALNELSSAADRKMAVMHALGLGLISSEQTQLLFDVYDLATA